MWKKALAFFIVAVAITGSAFAHWGENAVNTIFAVQGVENKQDYESFISSQDFVTIMKWVIPNISAAQADTIDRQTGAAAIGRALGLEKEGELAFLDKDQCHQDNVGYINALVEKGILKGDEKGFFKPQKSFTVAETAQVALRLWHLNSSAYTLAGDGEMGFLDGSGTGARFALPEGIAPSIGGGFYVADTKNSIIRRIDKDGKTTVFAGTITERDSYGFAVGGLVDGVKSKAVFDNPASIVASGNSVYLADRENNCIRVIRDNSVYTFAGSVTAGFADGSNSKAKFNQPCGLAESGGILYVADTLNHCIRKVDSKGNVTTIAGVPSRAGYKDGVVGEALFNEPWGVAVEGNKLYVSDSGNQRIRVIDLDSLRVTTLAGNGSVRIEGTDYIEGSYIDGNPEKATFNFPRGIDVVNGKVIVADTNNHAIRLISKDGLVSTIAGSEKNDLDHIYIPFNSPTDLVYLDKEVYVVDTMNNKIIKIPYVIN